YVNGTKILAGGKTGTDSASELPRWKREVIPIPTTQMNLLEIEASSYNHPYGGYWKPIRIGLYEDVKQARLQSIGIEVFFTGSLLSVGLFHFFLFLVRRQEWGAFFLS